MVADMTIATVLPAGSPLKDSVTVTNVTGGEETNPLWTSEVSTGDFRQALMLTLKQHTILASGNGPLTLDAALVTMDQPLVGFDMTVTSTVRYTVTRTGGAVIFEETLTVPYTANFSDAFIGARRLRLANEGAVKANIQRFIEHLVAASKVDPARFGATVTSALRLNLG